jgi:hypothetical protein
MKSSGFHPLPYRVAVDDLRRYVGDLARGRSADQIRSAGFSTKSFEGAATAIESLGLASDRSGALTEMGRRLALADEGDTAAVVQAVIEAFPPYATLLEAVGGGAAPRPTPLAWVETWWATHGYGSSESNRTEAAPVFAKLVEAAGLGRFVQGRKGRASRIEWGGEAAASARSVTAPSRRSRSGPERVGGEAGPEPRGAHVSNGGGSPTPAMDGAARTSVSTPAAEPPGPAPGESVLAWHLAAGRRVVLRVPADLSAAERARLRSLFEVLLDG